MQVVLVALNASYSHTSLACAYLKSYCQDSRWSVDILEFTINDHHRSILSRLAHTRADIYAFSCYIWNIDMVLRLCSDLKKAVPNCTIVLGGPEVSFESPQIMQEQPALDAVICGEGEKIFRNLLECMVSGQALATVAGVVVRHNHKPIFTGETKQLHDLDEIPSPLIHMNLQGRLVYYETSRGCPFTCAYCLSAAEPGVRYFSWPRIKRDLDFLMQSGAKVIKFVDRTFNCNERRARQIMEYILDNSTKNTRFHFEINAELLSDNMLDFLAIIPTGMFDFEIGIQSTSAATLNAINRRSNWDHLADRIKRLRTNGNIHLHVDLIAGLPYESYQRFTQSFNQVFQLNVDVIQLGFLKMLKGSPLRYQASQYQYIYQEHAPYEVLSNHVMSFAELDRLHYIEEMVERFYNTHRFEGTLKWLVEKVFLGDAFKTFEAMADFWVQCEYHQHQHNREAEYLFLLRYINIYLNVKDMIPRELLKIDYFTAFPTGRLPEEFERFNPVNESDHLYKYLKDDYFIKTHMPGLLELSPRERRRRLHLEWLKLDLDTGDYLDFARPTLFLYNSARSSLECIIQLHPD